MNRTRRRLGGRERWSCEDRAPTLPRRRRLIGRSVLIAAILGSSMIFIDGYAVVVALPTLQEAFNATVGQTQWVVESYALFLAALLLVGGVLGDRLGRRRIFLLGTILFAATSLSCALAPTIETLIAARAAQGMAAALLAPASLAIISATFTDEPERERAIGAWTGFTAFSAAAGPLLGGWLVEHASWRGVFAINVPLATIVVAATLRGVPESRDEGASQLDILGAFLVTAGLGGLVFGLLEAPQRGWGDATVRTALAGGVSAIVAFVVAETRMDAPMLPLNLFRSRTFAGANLLTLLLYSAFGGALFWLPFNLIQVQGYAPTAAGAAVAPAFLIVFALERWTGGLVGRFGARLPLTLGPVVVAVAFLLFALPGAGGSYWPTFFPAVVMLGIGMAITVPPLTTAVMSAVADHQAGTAAGINNAVARTAGVIAVAVFGVVVTTVFARQLDIRLSAMPTLSPTIAAAIVAQRADLAATDLPAGADPDTAAALTAAVTTSFVVGFRVAMAVGAALALLGAIAAWGMVEATAAPARVPGVPTKPSAASTRKGNFEIVTRLATAPGDFGVEIVPRKRHLLIRQTRFSTRTPLTRTGFKTR